MLLQWLSNVIPLIPPPKERSDQIKNRLRRTLLLDYFISQIRAEAGLFFEYADAKELAYLGKDGTSASLTNGKKTVAVRILNQRFGEFGESYPDLDLFGEKFTVHFWTLDHSSGTSFQDPQEIRNLYSIIETAISTFPFPPSSEVSISRDLETHVNHASLVCMELYGARDEVLIQWVEKAARILGSNPEFQPDCGGLFADDRAFLPWDGVNLWAQIRLMEPISHDDIIHKLNLETRSPAPGRGTCRQYLLQQSLREQYQIDRVYLKFRSF